MSGIREVVPWVTTIAGDVISAMQIPGGGFFGKLGDQYLKRKQEEAADILIEEIKKVPAELIKFEERDLDPMIEITYRFLKAASEGAARNNLQLLAQVIVGLKKNKALDPDKFRKWANILEQLTRDQLLVLGKAIAIRRAAGADVPNDFFPKLKSEMEMGGYPADEIDPLCASVSRYGLLIFEVNASGTFYLPTLWLDQLGALADLEGIAAAN